LTETVSARERSAAEWGGWIAVALLLALRLFHLSGPLDDPHSWRQCDTARASLEFVRRGVDLLHPSVCWLGNHRTLIFEFPLPEALSALLQRVFGTGEHWDRVVALGFFAVATLYFHRFIGLTLGARTAWLSTLAWLALPLGQFYSRAAHVDFAAIAGVHALLDHGARALRGGSRRHAAAAALGGALAAMIKAPYLLAAIGPLLLLGLAPAPMSGRLALLAAGIVTAVAFKLWRGHVDAVNAGAPDWFFLPGYYKEVNPLWWYFGEMAQRFDRVSWWRVILRLLREVATPPGVLIAFAAPLAAARPAASAAPPGEAAAGPRFGARTLAFAWAGGTLVYLLVFFPLNVIHDYYQIPFLAPAALLIGLGLGVMWDRARLAAIAALLLFLVVAVTSPSRLGYYRVDWLRVEAGRAIAARVPKDALVVACDHASGYSDPRLLHRADRNGWSLGIPDLSPTRVAQLEKLGATHVAVVTSPEHPESVLPVFLEPRREARVPIEHQGKRLGTLDLYRLSEAGGKP
jgi:hypothetical protein